MNLVPIILSTSTNPGNMQKRLWLATKWTPRIYNPNIAKAKAQGEDLEKSNTKQNGKSWAL